MVYLHLAIGLFKVVAIHGLSSYTVSDLCAPTHTPTIHLASETTLLRFTPLIRPHQCHIIVTWESDEMMVVMESQTHSPTCDQRIGIDWPKIPKLGREYVCLGNSDMDWMSLYKETEFTIVVNSTEGVRERMSDHVLIISPFYQPCEGTGNESDTLRCCQHGENERVADFGRCKAPGAFTCVHKNMMCDGVINCREKDDEDDCDGAVVWGGGWLWVAGWVVVVVCG